MKVQIYKIESKGNINPLHGQQNFSDLYRRLNYLEKIVEPNTS